MEGGEKKGGNRTDKTAEWTRLLCRVNRSSDPLLCGVHRRETANGPNCRIGRKSRGQKRRLRWWVQKEDEEEVDERIELQQELAAMTVQV